MGLFGALPQTPQKKNFVKSFFIILKNLKNEGLKQISSNPFLKFFEVSRETFFQKSFFGAPPKSPKGIGDAEK